MVNREKAEGISLGKPIYFIEYLSISSWFFCILPYVIKTGKTKEPIYFIESEKLSLLICRPLSRLIGAHLKQLLFRLVDVHDDSGCLIRARTSYFDVFQLQKTIFQRPMFQAISKRQVGKNRINQFLAKRISEVSWSSHSSLWRAQYIIQIIVWQLKKQNLDLNCFPVLFLSNRPWPKEIIEYAADYGIKTVFSGKGNINVKQILDRIFADKSRIVQGLYFCFNREGFLGFLRKVFFKQKKSLLPKSIFQRQAKLAVEYYGQFNLTNPEIHSDLFFWQQSELSAKDICLLFGLSQDPLDEPKLNQIKQCGMSAVGLYSKSVIASGAMVFYHYSLKNSYNNKQPFLVSQGEKSERKWLKTQQNYYLSLYNYWQALFLEQNIKLFISWYKYDAQHCVIADALSGLDGVSAIYQRAFEEIPCLETMTAADIVFGFSPFNADIERKSACKINYHVSVGYFGDHRFRLLTKPAQAIREKLGANGAKHILAFFDENSGSNPHWQVDHQFISEHYQFLLDKVLTYDWFGLVLKPKASSTLRRRLGALADKLKQAEDCGRCIVIEGGILHNSYPPALAALASDISVHSTLRAATAGFEAALNNRPTLLLDCEGWPVSLFYQFGENKIVFKDWQTLWRACCRYWQDPGAIVGFGDWSKRIDQFEPFRDGRAAERIGSYLKWVIEGFNSGLSKETTLADAAQRYVDLWGKDKVTELV